MVDYYANPLPRYFENVSDDELNQMLDAIKQFSPQSSNMSIAFGNAILSLENMGRYHEIDKSPVHDYSLHHIEQNRAMFLPIAAEFILRASQRGETPNNYWDDWVSANVFCGFDTKDVLDLASAWKNTSKN